MERRGRASDCQRSYDFTQNDLPPPLTAEHTPRSRLAPAYPQRDEHGTPSGAIRADIRRGGTARWACDAAVCPFLGFVDAILLNPRIPPGRFSAQAVSIRGASQCYIGFVSFKRTICSRMGSGADFR
jgi:hypothetical protein